ncbi:MAG TPA: glycosyltransferase family 4 protein [Pyrinomonadaceae bacterium]|jgi:glycosyltransferase involved in cell wall biosynthesis|nr:glycosyltransferase family 4 protein [Pyrinomonadaceae bacterium]
MRVLILNQFFYPDYSATSQLMTDLAESLVEQGVEVTALSSRSRYQGGAPLPSREQYRGVRIERAWATSFGKGSIAGRLSDYLSFFIGATWRLARTSRPDIVLALTTPPLIGLVAIIVGRLRGTRTVALVQDVYPDVAVALGTLREGSPATRLLDYLSRVILRRADRIIVLGDCMRERIIKKIGESNSSRVDVIRNWADASQFDYSGEDEEENPFVAEHHLEDRFVVLFSGNLGRVNEFGTVLDAARILRERREILFLFIGEGAQKSEIEDFVARHGLGNVRLLPYQPRAQLRYSLRAGHALLVALRDGLAGLSVPSKAYTILAAGRALLYVGDGGSDVARMVLEHECGAVLAAGESERLAQVIIGWADDREKLLEMNSAARAAFEKSFERGQAVSAYLKTFERCLKSDSPDTLNEAARLEENSP